MAQDATSADDSDLRAAQLVAAAFPAWGMVLAHNAPFSPPLTVRHAAKLIPEFETVPSSRGHTAVSGLVACSSADSRTRQTVMMRICFAPLSGYCGNAGSTLPSRNRRHAADFLFSSGTRAAITSRWRCFLTQIRIFNTAFRYGGAHGMIALPVRPS